MTPPSKREPSRRMLQRRGRGPHRRRPAAGPRWPIRLLLLAAVLAAVLVILLRMAEFTGGRVRHPRFRPAHLSARPVELRDAIAQMRNFALL
jgi:hypothetical protein